MDIILPGIIIQFLGCITSIITTLAIVCVATGWFTLALPPIMFLYISVQRFYIPACRELQRIESISRSPIYSGLGEGRQRRGDDSRVPPGTTLHQHLGQTHPAQRGRVCHPETRQWMARHLPRLLGTVIVGCAAFLVIQGKVSAGIAGLCLVYALDVTKYLSVPRTWTWSSRQR